MELCITSELFKEYAAIIEQRIDASACKPSIFDGAIKIIKLLKLTPKITSSRQTL